MRYILLFIVSLLFIACGDNANSIILDSTKGNVNTDIKPHIVFKDDVTQNTNTIIESGGEIKINGKPYYGKYVFSKPNVLLLLNEEPFTPNTDYKIAFDFEDMNKRIASNIKAKSFVMNFSTNPLLSELTSAVFTKDSNDLSKIKLDANLAISQIIPLEKLKDNIYLLDSADNKIDIKISEVAAREYQITSEPLESPSKDTTYKLVLDKKLGSKENIIFNVLAQKETGLRIIDIHPIINDKASIEIKFSAPLAKNLNINNFIKISPNVNFQASQANDKVIITGDFKIDNKYNIEILNGIKSQDDISLDQNYNREIDFSNQEPKVIFSNNGIFLPDSSNKKIAFKSINVKRAKIIIRKIYANNITQFIQNSNLLKNSTNDNYEILYNFDLLGDILKEQDITINAPTNTWVQNEIDLSNIKDLSGIFIISIHFGKDDVDYKFKSGISKWRINDYFYNNGNVFREVIFSNIALIAQKYANNIIVSALDIKDNKPLSDVEIKGISSNNQVISSSKTDKLGNATIAFSGSGPLKGKNVFYISATDSKNFALIKLNSQEIQDDGFDTDGVSSKNGIRAFIYTDRGVYRPGEKVNLTIIARNNKDSIAHPIKLSIINPRGKKEINDISLKPINDGVFYYGFDTKKDYDTGIYDVKINIGDNIFNYKVALESVVPNRIRANISSPDEIDLNKNNAATISLQSDYLFGAPASKLKYTIDAYITAKNFVSKNYPNYSFTNPTNLLYSDNKEYSGILNENGYAQQKISLSGLDNVNKNLEANIIARVFENNGRSMTARKKIYLKRFDSFVGIKNPKDRYVKVDDNVSLNVVLIDEKEHFIKGRKLEYTIYQNNYSWWWDYDNYNDYIRSIKSDKNTTIIKKGELISEDSISSISFKPKDRGEILVEVRDTTNNQSASVTLYASSWGEPINIDKITQLKIKTDKKEYHNNEEAKIVFESTKNAKALVTISYNDEILDRYWINTDDKESVIKLKVDEKYAPNMYVSVFLLQDYDKLNNDRALRLYGVVPINIINEKNKILPNIDVKDEVLPNSTLHIGISNQEKKQVTYTLAIVDEGLLNLTGFKTPSPYNYFYAKTKYNIKNYDTFDYIIAKTSGRVDKTYSIGGDEAVESIQNKNKQKDDNADRFKPVVYFLPPTKSDASGNAKVDFKVPSYLGSLRVMLVAIDKDSYGSISKDVRVSAPVVMLPTIPRSLKINDDFILPIEVIPIKDNVKSAKIEIKSDGIISFNKSSENLVFNDKKPKTIFFNGKVKEELGIENINIKLESGDFSMQDSTQIDIKAPNPYMVVSKNYILNPNSTLDIASPTSFVKNSNSGKITISASPLLSIDHRLMWLIHYPYGCVEQTTSSVFPQLFIDKLSNADFINKQDIINNINAGISRIQTFQVGDGGLSYWQGGSSSDKWGSSYAAYFLIMAKKQGYYVSDELLNRLMQYLSNNISYNDIFPLFLLALNDNARLGIMNEIYENRLNNLSVTNKWLLAASYKLAGFDDIATKISNNLSVEPNEADIYYRNSYGSILRNKAMIFQAYQIINNRANEKLYNEIKDKLESNDWLSTQTISYALLALASVKDDVKNAKLEGEITLNNNIQKFDEDKDKLTFNLASGNAKITSKNKLFVNYTWQGISADNKGDNIAKNMVLKREFVTFDNNYESPIDISNLKSSQSFYIKLTLEGVNDEPIDVDNIALTQNLPSGWEIENTRLNNDTEPRKVEEANRSVAYTDIRDDKIMWFFYAYDKKVVYVKINAVTPGIYTLPPAYAEVMYNGAYQASTDSLRVKVLVK